MSISQCALSSAYIRFSVCLAVTGLWSLGTPVAVRAVEPSGKLRTHEAALGDYTTDAPGVRRLIAVEDIPNPDTKASADRGAHIVPRPAGAMPKVPPGFEVELLVEKLENPRKIVTAPNG